MKESESDTSRHESDSYSLPRRLGREINGCQETKDIDEEDGDGGDILEQAIQKILDDGQHLDERFFLDVRLPHGMYMS